MVSKSLFSVIFFLFFCSRISLAGVVSGKVVDDEDDSPLPGVTVLLKGTTRGTLSDFEGKFKLKIPDGKQQLEFRSIGYKIKTIIVNYSPCEINVFLKEDVSRRRIKSNDTWYTLAYEGSYASPVGIGLGFRRLYILGRTSDFRFGEVYADYEPSSVSNHQLIRVANSRYATRLQILTLPYRRVLPGEEGLSVSFLAGYDLARRIETYHNGTEQLVFQSSMASGPGFDLNLNFGISIFKFSLGYTNMIPLNGNYTTYPNHHSLTWGVRILLEK